MRKLFGAFFVFLVCMCLIASCTGAPKGTPQPEIASDRVGAPGSTPGATPAPPPGEPYAGAGTTATPADKDSGKPEKLAEEVAKAGTAATTSDDKAKKDTEGTVSPSTTPMVADALRGSTATGETTWTEAAPAKPPAASPTTTAGTVGSAKKPVASASGLKAGFSDDNAQFNYFVDFLKKYATVPHLDFDISERLAIRVLDVDGKPVANAQVSIYAPASAGSNKAGKLLAAGTSFSDGIFRFYPKAQAGDAKSFLAAIGGSQSLIPVQRDGKRTVDIKLGIKRAVPAPVPLDVLFVMDTTGSMGEEIERLRSTIEIIHSNISALKPRPLVRFGMVLYKDRGDAYITEIVPFTGDVDAFQRELDKVSASGGGDGPEDLETALDDAVNKMDWNKDGVRTVFVVTDAEPHLDYYHEYTYMDAANDARAKGIKIYTIGTGGLPLEGEYVLRQVSQLTEGKYIFLTYGEKTEAGGGTEGSVSHHTGANFTTDKLEAIIIRFVRDEVANLSDTPPVVDESYFTADKISAESRDQTLDALFEEALGNLSDYSTFKIDASTTCAVLPITPMADGIAPTAEYFAERLSMTGAKAKRFKLVERKDLQKVLKELELQLSGLVDDANAAKVGQFLGADILVAGTLYKRADRYELFLKLVRVSTAEVLAVTRAKIDFDLGL